jgi:hypothetical protein
MIFIMKSAQINCPGSGCYLIWPSDCFEHIGCVSSQLMLWLGRPDMTWEEKKWAGYFINLATCACHQEGFINTLYIDRHYSLIIYSCPPAKFIKYPAHFFFLPCHVRPPKSQHQLRRNTPNMLKSVPGSDNIASGTRAIYLSRLHYKNHSPSL